MRITRLQCLRTGACWRESRPFPLHHTVEQRNGQEASRTNDLLDEKDAKQNWRGGRGTTNAGSTGPGCMPTDATRSERAMNVPEGNGQIRLCGQAELRRTCAPAQAHS